MSRCPDCYCNECQCVTPRQQLDVIERATEAMDNLRAELEKLVDLIATPRLWAKADRPVTPGVIEESPFNIGGSKTP